MPPFSAVYNSEVTLTQAIAECYMLSPKEKTGAVICFEITFPDGKESLKFGQNWDRTAHDWWYFEKMPGLPAFACEEAHFVSNIICSAGILRYIRRSRGGRKS